MNRLFYPALFHKAEEGGFWVSFPDIPECLTQGDDMIQAYEMAADALGLALTSREKEQQQIPSPSDPSEIVPEPDSFMVVVEFDMLSYKKRTSSRAVKKTLSIPEWLNEAAMEHNINFSQVLQDALKTQLHLG
ncbi:MAG: type II toxin-antitoxin system HicB family antitoxin [Clostridium sp.]|nr:type II toxin-antitoxin system HicB family antitoxin [Clostridium sp.]